jgi:hypothetical protein
VSQNPGFGRLRRLSCGTLHERPHIADAKVEVGTHVDQAGNAPVNVLEILGKEGGALGKPAIAIQAHQRQRQAATIASREPDAVVIDSGLA